MTPADLQKLRELWTNPPQPTCIPDCEHIECAYVVACDRWNAAQVCAARDAVPALIDEIERLRECVECHDTARTDVIAQNDELRARLAGAEAANAATLVEHLELNGHIDIVEQCRDYLACEADPSGRLADFIESLRVVIDQLDKQRRSRNWYEAAYTAGKQKLIEHAMSEVCCKGEPHTCDQEAIAAAEGRTDRMIIERDALRALLGDLRFYLERQDVETTTLWNCINPEMRARIDAALAAGAKP